MTFPTHASATSGDCAASATRTLTLPGSISSGNLLLALHAGGTSGSATWPAGWTELFDVSAIQAAYKHADGTEGASIDITYSTTTRASVYQVHLFTGGTFKTPVHNRSNHSNTVAGDPPNLNTGWGSIDTTWCAIDMHGSKGDSVAGVYPTNYNDNQLEYLSTIEALGGGIQFATRNLTANTENPGAYPIVNVAGSGVTIAIALETSPSGLIRSFGIICG